MTAPAAIAPRHASADATPAEPRDFADDMPIPLVAAAAHGAHDDEWGESAYPHFDEATISRPLSLEVDGISLVVPSGVRALDGVRFRVKAGERVAIVGPSGAGKSSLIACISGETRQTSGCVRLSRACWSRLNTAETRLLKTRIGRIYQDFRLVPTYSALRNVLLGRLGHASTFRSMLGFGRGDRAKAMGFLEELGLAERAHCPARRLSGGEKQRLAIARALMQDPGILLADEPVASLDAQMREQVVERLVAVNERHGISILAVFHDVCLAERFAPRAIVLCKGRVVYDGPSMNLRGTMNTCLAWNLEAPAA